jgi:hypothetical protein
MRKTAPQCATNNQNGKSKMQNIYPVRRMDIGFLIRLSASPRGAYFW